MKTLRTLSILHVQKLRGVCPVLPPLKMMFLLYLIAVANIQEGNSRKLRIAFHSRSPSRFSCIPEAAVSLHEAIETGNRPRAQRIIESCPGALDVPCQVWKRGHGGTSVHVAVICERTDILLDILQADASTGVRDADGNTPLQLAALNGNTPAVSALLETGADINSEVSEKFPPLVAAASNGNLNVIELLLRKGANPDTLSKSGYSALGVAAKVGAKPIVISLLQAGADVNLRGFEDGGTALHAAAKYGESIIMKLLVENGVDVTIRDNKGRSAGDVVCECHGNCAEGRCLPNQKVVEDVWYEISKEKCQASPPPSSSPSFIKRIWNKIKGFFVKKKENKPIPCEKGR